MNDLFGGQKRGCLGDGGIRKGMHLEGAKERATTESDREEAQCEEGTAQEETPGRD